MEVYLEDELLVHIEMGSILESFMAKTMGYKVE